MFIFCRIPPCRGLRWFDELVSKDQWIEHLLVSCIFFPSSPSTLGDSTATYPPDNNAVAFYFYIPAPIGNGGWEFLKTITANGKSVVWKESDRTQFFANTSIIRSNFSYDDVRSAVQQCKEESQNNLEASSIFSLCVTIRNKINGKREYFLIECTDEQCPKTSDVESRLFVLFDAHQTAYPRQTALFGKTVVKSAADVTVADDARFKNWGLYFLSRFLDYNSLQLNQFGQCFYSCFHSSLKGLTESWPLPFINFNLGFGEVTGRLHTLLTLFLLDHGICLTLSNNNPSGDLRSAMELPLNVSRDALLKKLWTGIEQYTNTIQVSELPDKNGITRNDFPSVTDEVWRVRKISFYVWGKFYDFGDRYFVNLESDTTIFCGLSNSAYSFNQPKFCPTAAWNPFGTTFANQTTAGRDLVAFFININNTVYTISPDKKQILMWINNSISPNKFISANLFIPISMFVTNNGDIYYENGFDNGRVDKWISNTSTFVTVMNVDSQCYGLFIDNNNTLYCSMYDHHKILKRWLNESEPILTIAAGTGSRGSASNQLFHPFGIFVDLNFDLYVADYYNHRIQLFKSGELNGITIVGEESSNNIISLLYPSGIVLDADKYLFIVDHYYSRIFRSGLNDIRCIIGCDGGGSQSHQLSGPRSLSFDSYGNIFITDSFIHRIQKFDFLPNSCGKFKK
ncbi:unnamed protein product [Adineta steineri]|uniref:Uncharacterized protein n=1 Tax=Adineta steineri TaxID=433720 RepID=A0A819BDE1_9BILA|nr:unnamed protein product [Adineta steineri]